MVNKTKMNLSKVQAYIPKIFTELRVKNNWNLYQTKLFIYILSKFYKYKIKIEKEKYTSKNIEIIDINHIPTRFELNRKEIIQITKMSTSQFSREIKKVTTGIMESVATIPSIYEPENMNSYKNRKWFEDFEYLAGKGILFVEVDKYVMPYLVVFANYARIKLSDIFMFKNNYSCDLYILLKLSMNTYTKNNKLKLTLDEFKEKINMAGTYQKNNAMFQKKVLFNINYEINKLTDINFKYDLLKTGKKFSDIIIYFSQKEKTSNYCYDSDIKNNRMKEVENLTPKSIRSLPSIAINILNEFKKHKISVKKSNDLLFKNGKKACEESIQKLFFELEKGTPIKNTAGYLIKCIENHGDQIKSTKITMDLAIKKELRNKNDEEKFIQFDRYISKNNERILPLIAKYEENQKIFDDEDIDMLKSLHELIVEYKDIANNKTPLTISTIVNGKTKLVTYEIINNITQGLIIADNLERIDFLKKKLITKEFELSKLDNKTKPRVEQELVNIKIKIADLV